MTIARTSAEHFVDSQTNDCPVHNNTDRRHGVIVYNHYGRTAIHQLRLFLYLHFVL